ncbi:MAG TPA: hypothetical protein DEA44_15020 [Firmicutes bacterium]|nr:hypothetical protein [Bacillota bacterium]
MANISGKKVEKGEVNAMKKLAKCMVVLYLMVCFIVPAVAATTTVPGGFSESIAALETLVYGQEKSGPYVERVNGLELTVFGKNSGMPVPDKIARLTKAFYDNSEQTSIPTILRYAESQLLHETGTGPAVNRVNKLEEALTGKQETGGLTTRLEKILKTVFSSGTVKLSDTEIPAKTLVKIRLLDALNSDMNKTGDTFRYEVVDNVKIGNVLVIPAGTLGVGKVEKAKKAGRFGQHGKLDLSFNTVPAMDDTPVSVYLGERAREENKHVVAAAGASVVGAALLGPIGLIGGAFVEGKTVNLPAGTEFFIEVHSNITVKGASLEENPAGLQPVQIVEDTPVSEIRIKN